MMNNMKTFEELKNTLSAHKKELREKYAVKEIGIFGSYVRGEQKKKSDVDVLVEFEESANLSLLDFIGLENYLSDVLGVKVDLVEKHTLKPRIGKHVLEEVVNV
jgi:predicted nucleotidyltransferase